MDSLKDEVMELRNKLKEKDEESKEHDKYVDLLNELFSQGIIDSNQELLNKLNYSINISNQLDFIIFIENQLNVS